MVAAPMECDSATPRLRRTVASRSRPGDRGQARVGQPTPELVAFHSNGRPRISDRRRCCKLVQTPRVEPARITERFSAPGQDSLEDLRGTGTKKRRQRE